MAKKTLGYTKLVWACPRCSTRNPGPNAFCNGCGGPQPEGVRFEQPAESELITDAAEVARARAGPDRHCPYCGARNQGVSKFCGACGGDLAGAKARESGRVVGAHKAPSGQTRPCPACGTANPLTSLRCSNCGSALPMQETPEPPPAPASPRRASRAPAVVVGGLVALACLAGAALLFLSGRRQEVTATVDQIHWERSIEVEAIRPVQHSDWQDQVPAAARSLSCELAFFETADEPAPVATEVCGTPYTIDEGSGYGQVVQDCSYRVYQTRCSYLVDEWTSVDRLQASGNDLLPHWPSTSLGTGERQGARSEVYQVTLLGPSGSYGYSPETESEFASFSLGSQWRLTLNGLGGLVSLEPLP